MLAPLFLKASRLTMRWLIGLSALLFTVLAAKSQIASLTGPVPYLCLLWVWLLGFYIVHFKESNIAIFLMCAPLAIIPRFSDEPQGAFLWTFTVVLIFFGHKVQLSKPVAAVAQKLGDFSYSLYLVHVCAFTYCYHIFNTTNPALMLLCALAMSMAVHYCVELPVNHFRRIAVKNKAKLSLAAP
jgi:peptidoglycan/LPS O-acetylase OafA/YrhL